MKPIKLIFLTAFLSLGLWSNAQTFIEGSIGFSSSRSEEERTAGTQKTAQQSFNFMPSFGKFISENFSVGVGLNISSLKNKTDYTTESVSKSTTLGIRPFLRYYVLRWNSFSVYGQGTLGLDLSKMIQESDGVTDQESDLTNFNIRITPGLSYDINDNLSLITSINMLNLSYNYSIQKGDDEKRIGSSFNFGAGLGNILTVGAIHLGAIYKF
jgi:hypothetical protein